MEIGAQLYTVREFCKTPSELSETLKKIADIGYKNVQASGICEYDPQWLKNELDKNGLRCTLTHISPERISDSVEAVIADHNIIQCNYIGIGYYEIHKKGIQDFYDRFAQAGETIYKSGKQLCYHNHDHEFIKLDGKTVMKWLTEKFTSKQLGFIIDTYWVQAGGADPIFWINLLKGRVPCVHLKDMEYGRKMAALGTGNINLDGVLDACGDADTKYLFVEQDDCYGQNPFDCLKISYDFLKSRGL